VGNAVAIKYLKDPNQIIPDLIFLDIKMPRINGWKFLEEYKTLEVSKKNLYCPRKKIGEAEAAPFL